MCGISFYYSVDQDYDHELASSLEAIAHRGPDARDTKFVGGEYGRVGIGHNRLSIMDPVPRGDQPMIRSGVILAFNGEIYNFQELRVELERKGHVLVSNTDTEVLLYSYIEFGTAAFRMLRGMFSFVLFDTGTNQLYLVRDTLGIKPLYFFQSGDDIFCCSEIKGLKQFPVVDFEVSRDDVFEFFNNGFLYEPATGFEYIKKVLPGHYLNIDLAVGKSQSYKYSDEDVCNSGDTLDFLVEQALTRQKVSDVPLGVFFSGGADSSILAAKTESTDLLFASYDRDSSSDNDLRYSKLIADFLGRKLNITNIQSAEKDKEHILSSFAFVARNSEELISDYTFWSTYLLSKAAHEKGYKVMLSGMGGDEAFAGYPRYLVLKYHWLVKFFAPALSVLNRINLIPNKMSKTFERLVSYSSEKNWAIAYSRLLGYFSTSDLNQLFDDFDRLNESYSLKLRNIKAQFSGDDSDKVKLGQHYDRTGFLSHNLSVADKASMLASIELRVPLLDESVYSYGLSLETSSLISGRTLKNPLRLLLGNTIPKHLVDRPKTGFNPPLDGLIETLGAATLLEEISNLSDIFDLSVLESIVNSHFNREKNNTYKIWQLIYFSLWRRANCP